MRLCVIHTKEDQIRVQVYDGRTPIAEFLAQRELTPDDIEQCRLSEVGAS